MADFPVLTSADGSTSFNIGSVMLADGVDYGMAAMFTNMLGGNPLVDGGALGARFSGPRMFKFPIRAATVGNLTPAGVTRALRQMAQSGAWIDLMLSNAAGGQIATADAVRFDVIDGRVRETQDVKMWSGAGRREGVLEVDVQPYGYLPTWIILASVPSIALPGRITIPGASIIGDVPGLAQINSFAYLPSQQLGAAGTYGYDNFLYAFGNKSPAFIPAASMSPIVVNQGFAASLVGDAAAPGSQILRIFMSPSANAFYPVQAGFLPFVRADMNPTHAGRYRLHAFARNVSPSSGVAIPLTAEVSQQYVGAPSSLASGGIVASVGQPLTLASDGAYMPMPTGFGFYPLGDIFVPTMIAAAQHSIKIWGVAPSVSFPTYVLDIAGVWMQSLDAAQGVIARDLQSNTSAGATYYNPYAFSIDAYQRDVTAHSNASAIGGLASTQPPIYMASQTMGRSLLDRYRGTFPVVSPSLIAMEVMMAARRLQVSYRNEVLTDTPKVWWRFNEPSGASTVLDYSGNGVNGAASNLLLGASSLLYGEPGGATNATGFAFAVGAALPINNSPKTVEAWYNPATYAGGFQIIAALGASDSTAQTFGLSFNPTSVNALSIANNASWAYAWKPGLTYHLAAAYDGTNIQMYVNGQGLGTTTLPAATPSVVGRLNVGNTPVSGANRAPGGIDEVAVYASALSANRVLAHYVAGRSAMGATSPPVYQQGGYAGVSLRYQPRFTFTKEI